MGKEGKTAIRISEELKALASEMLVKVIVLKEFDKLPVTARCNIVDTLKLVENIKKELKEMGFSKCPP